VTYRLKVDENRVVRFLRHFEGLSREGRIRLFVNLDSDLREHGDFYRQDPDRRLAPGSQYFWYQIVFQDEHGDGRVRQFSFIVNDTAAVYGILQIEYVEVTEGPPLA
jgi:hypothetical protein